MNWYTVRIETDTGNGYLHNHTADRSCFYFTSDRAMAFKYEGGEYLQQLVTDIGKGLGVTEEETKFNDFPIWVEKYEISNV